jgi:AraC-like DNA-binding protein
LREFLSFLAVIDDLGLRDGIDGMVVRHIAGALHPRSHRHAELELNLVVRGTASYLMNDRRYDLTAGTVTWLFPDQEHVLVDESADHALWWAVFRPSAVARIATSPDARPLLERDPVGRYSRRVDPQRVQRLGALFRELSEASTVDDIVFNAGLSYLLASAWRAFLDSSDVVDHLEVHPAVNTAARLLQADPDAGDLTDLSLVVGLSPSHLSRLFTSQMGVSISRYRNQQRLERFMRLYGRGRRTTAIVAAHEAGFGSYAQFHRVFRKETGRSPSALRAAATDEQWSPTGATHARETGDG